MTKLLTVDQFAEALGLKPATVRMKLSRGQLEHVRIGRTIRFRPEQVEKMIEKSIVPAREVQ
jgi:excisionase family DNA binding protein